MNENTDLIGSNQIEKHHKYKNYYGDNELYWGLGIENELYLEFEKKICINKNNFLNCHKKERYSLDYFLNYNKNYINDLLIKYFDHNSNDGDTLDIPLILNSHSFTKTDIYNNSKTLYTVKGEPNPYFTGLTLLESLQSVNPYFYDNDKWLFDGDLVEFTTLNFYKNKLPNIITELKDFKEEFILNLNDSFNQLNIFKEYGNIHFMSRNYPVTTHLTNLGNISLFNNGTLHFNLTLPTFISNGKIVDKEKFKLVHKEAIKIIQWFEPILISIYGSADPFVKYISENEICASSSSQRCIMSRYISIGTFDTDIMEPGKIVTRKIKDLEFTNNEFWWYNRVHEKSIYTKLEEVGYDINFNKHWNHGIELRIFDHICDYNDLYKCFEFIIFLCDIIFSDSNTIINPIKDEIWNNIVYNCMIYGKNYVLSPEEKNSYENILGFKVDSSKIIDFFEEVYLKIKKMDGPFSSLVL